jgi:phage terminase large subunit-like protein
VSTLAASVDLERFAEECGLHLESFQKRIVGAIAGPEPEILITMPRGGGKTSLTALVALHHLITVPGAAIYVAAASRQQASLLFEYADRYARALEHPNIVHRHLELRWCDDPDEPKVHSRKLEVRAADARKLHGLTFSLAVIDELQAHADDQVYIAMASALHKQAGAKLLVISTAGMGADSPLGKLRKRALALPTVKSRGAFTDARGPGLRMLEWGCPEDTDLDDTKAVKAANVASWITVPELRRAREALPEIAYRRFVMNQWTEREGHWLPPGRWQQCVGQPEFTDGEEIYIGADLGGQDSASAVAWVNDRLHVGVGIYERESGLLEVADHIRDLARRYRPVEICFDPWGARQLAAELESEGLTVVEVPQHDSRMIPASAGLHEAIVQRQLVLPDDPVLASHAASAIARHSRRGWRIDRPPSRPHIDAIIALALALDAQQNRPEPVVLHGFV